MGLAATLRKGALFAKLLRTKEIRLGGCSYRTKAFLVNHLALQGSTETCEPWLNTVYQTVLRCREGAFLDVGANIGQTSKLDIGSFLRAFPGTVQDS